MSSGREIPNISVPSSSFSPVPRQTIKGIGFWNSYASSPQYLTREPQNRLISPEELAEHTSLDDLWMAFRNGPFVEVYDMTPFAEFHPGGADILAQYGGTDATEAFRCAHAYISVNMISRLKMGRLVQTGRTRPSPKFLSPTMNIMSRPPPSLEQKPTGRPRWNWTTFPKQALITLEIDLRRQLASLTPSRHLVAIAQPDEREPQRTILRMRVLLDTAFYLLTLRLLPDLTPDVHSIRFNPTFPIVSTNPQVCVNLKFSKQSSDVQFSTLGSVLQDEIVSFSNMPIPGELFDCKVTASQRLDNSPHRLLRLRFSPETVHLSVPLLNHVFLKVPDEDGLVHLRPYTPTCVKLSPEEEGSTNAAEVDIIAKVYPHGTVSRLLDHMVEGTTLQVSLPHCQVDPSVLLRNAGTELLSWQCVCMLCGGTGITPFLPLIRCLLSMTDACLHLLWFNRLEQDLILRPELDELAASARDRFHVHYWLDHECESSPLHLPNVTIGRIGDKTSREYLKTQVKTLTSDLLCLICGSPGFNFAATTLTQAWGVPSNNVHTL